MSVIPADGERVLTIRSTLSRDLRWSAICSGCPLWTASRLNFGAYRAAVRAHRGMHARQGVRVGV